MYTAHVLKTAWLNKQTHNLANAPSTVQQQLMYQTNNNHKSRKTGKTAAFSARCVPCFPISQSILSADVSVCQTASMQWQPACNGRWPNDFRWVQDILTLNGLTSGCARRAAAITAVISFTVANQTTIIIIISNISGCHRNLLIRVCRSQVGQSIKKTQATSLASSCKVLQRAIHYEYGRNESRFSIDWLIALACCSPVTLHLRKLATSSAGL